MKSPLISIVILTYENADKIFHTLDSVLLQDYPHIELIISDDGSKVFPKDKIISYMLGKNMAYKIRLNPMNLGTVAHCNAAAYECIGVFIKFLASGDGFFEKTSLRKLVGFAQENPHAPVVTSVSQVCNDDFSSVYYSFPSLRRVKIINNIPPEKLFDKLIFSNIISTVGTLFRREFFTEYSGFDSSYRLLEDWPSWLRLTRSGISIPCYPFPTVYYAVGGISSEKGTAFESERLRNDLILCYQREIFPYYNKSSFLIKAFAQYQFKKLIKLKSSPMERAFLSIKYAPFEIYRGTKALIKYLLKITGG